MMFLPNNLHWINSTSETFGKAIWKKSSFLHCIPKKNPTFQKNAGYDLGLSILKSSQWNGIFFIQNGNKQKKHNPLPPTSHKMLVFWMEKKKYNCFLLRLNLAQYYKESFKIINNVYEINPVSWTSLFTFSLIIFWSNVSEFCFTSRKLCFT